MAADSENTGFRIYTRYVQDGANVRGNFTFDGASVGNTDQCNYNIHKKVRGVGVFLSATFGSDGSVEAVGVGEYDDTDVPKQACSISFHAEKTPNPTLGHNMDAILSFGLEDGTGKIYRFPAWGLYIK